MRSHLQRAIPASSLALLALLVGLTTSSPYVLQQGTILFCFGLAVVGLAFAVHVSGEFLLAQGAVFALSGYAAAIATTRGGLSFAAALAVACGFGALLGLTVGLAALRTVGWYFAMASFFLAAIVPNLLNLFPSLTGAETGLFGVPLAAFGEDPVSGRQLYVGTLVVLAAATGTIAWLRRTRWGVAMATARERAAAAASLGYTTGILRVTVFTLCSIPAAIGGAVYAHLFGFLQPGLFPLNQTIMFFTAVVIGGRLLAGNLVALTVLFVLPLAMLDAGANKDIIYSAVVIVVAVCVAYGDEAQRWRARLLGRLPQVLRGALPAAWVAGPMVTVEHAETSVEGARAAVALLQGRSRREDRSTQPLRARGVQVRFGEFRAVDFAPDQEFTVMPGRVHALLGANGSGKTTLLNALSGHVPCAGDIAIGGMPARHLAPARRARLGLGRSWQSPALPGELTPLELLTFAMGSPSGPAGPAAGKRDTSLSSIAAEVLACTGLGAVADKRAGLLPSAHRRFLDLLLSIARPVDFVMLDEPGAGLTRAERQTLGEMVRALADHGVGVALIEHDLDLAIRVADDVTVLNAGAPIYQGPPDGVRADAMVRQAFLGLDVPEPSPAGGQDDSRAEPKP